MLFIVEYVESHGVAPTFEEMLAPAGIVSKAGIIRMLNGLEDRGFIRRLRGRSRAIEVLRHPIPMGMERAAWHLKEAIEHLQDEDNFEANMGRIALQTALVHLEKARKKVAA